MVSPFPALGNRCLCCLLLLLLQEVEDELKRIGHTLKPLDIVVVNTAAGKKYGQVGYHAQCMFGLQHTSHSLSLVMMMPDDVLMTEQS